MALPDHTWLKYQLFEYETVRQVLVSDWLSWTLLTARWCIVSKSVNHISDHVLKWLSRSAISTDQWECVAKFRLVSGLANALKIFPSFFGVWRSDNAVLVAKVCSVWFTQKLIFYLAFASFLANSSNQYDT